MSPEEVRQVIEAATELDAAAPLALRLAAVAGLRRGEITGLRWSSMKDGVVTIDHQVVADRGAEECYVYGPTKTANRRRIALDDHTIRMWNELRIARQAITPWLFGDSERTPAPDRVGWWWRRARELSGIDEGWRLHDLRHFSATWAIAGGHDVRAVAAQLGHADASMTMRVYAHAVQSRDSLIAATMADVLDGAGRKERHV